MKKILALLLAAAMTLSLAVSCGEEKTSSSDSTASGSGSSSEETITPLTEITLPIVEDPITVTDWIVWSSDYNTIDEVEAYQELERLTNIHVEYTTILGSAATEKFGLLLASGDYPDIVDVGAGSGLVQYPGGDDAGIDDGIWRDLTDLVPIYMPNYRELINQNENARRESITDQGRYAGIYMLRCKYGSIEDKEIEIVAEPSWLGMVVRKDWLDELGLEIPVTVDDLYNVLVAFKEAGYGRLGMAGNGMIHANVPYVLGAWGVTNEFYIEEDKATVGYGPVTDEYREYCSMMNKWYEEGLIYQDFMSNDIGTNGNTLWANGTLGVYAAGWVGINDYLYLNGFTDDPDFWLEPMLNPVMNEGEIPKVTYQSDTALAPMYITTSCPEEYVPYLLQWADYGYTWEGMLLGSHGVEGVTYEVDPNSEYYYVYTDRVMKREISGAILDPFTARNLCVLANFHCLYNWEAQQNLYRQAGQGKQINGYDVWGQETQDIMVPLRVSFTSEEGNEFNNIYVDCKSYVEENTVQFIVGTLDVNDDAVWEKFVSDLESMNYQRCLELKQTAYTRYMNK